MTTSKQRPRFLVDLGRYFDQQVLIEAHDAAWAERFKRYNAALGLSPSIELDSEKT